MLSLACSFIVYSKATRWGGQASKILHRSLCGAQQVVKGDDSSFQIAIEDMLAE